MKILINTPSLKIPGGVANHYKGLKNFWNSNVKYNYIGSRTNIPGYIAAPFDILKFIYFCVFWKPDVILLNPSLAKRAIKRDFLYLSIASVLKIKTVVFFHGWKKEIAKEIEKNTLPFIKNLRKASGCIVLASSFKKQLEHWGFEKPILLSSTKVDDKLVKNNTLNKKAQFKTILFLTRIEVYKGIYIAIDAYNIIKQQHKDMILKIVGSGNELGAVKNYVTENNIEDVVFTGELKGKKLVNAYNESSMYILPSFSEGMPTSVLEAMAFGLPVISRPVGGLIDFFENKKMGFLIESFNPIQYAEKMDYLLNHTQYTNNISLYNADYAKKNFLASSVAPKIEKFLSIILTNEK